MPAITHQTSYQSGSRDFEQGHLERHQDEQTWREIDGEDYQPIERLTENPEKKTPLELAFEIAYSQGLKNPDEWKIRNEAKRTDKQELSYREYLDKSFKNQKSALEKSDPETRRPQLEAVDKNDGLGIIGNLYYLGNVEVYSKILEEKGAEALKNYREFERQTLREFHQSDEYQLLHPYESIAEIHNDEMGAIHLQTQEVWGRTDGRDIYRIARTQMQDDIVSKMDLSGTEFETTQEELLKLPKKSAARQDLAKELYIDINKNFLQKVAEKNSIKLLGPIGLKWVREYDVSDGVRLSKKDYIAKKDQAINNQKIQELIHQKLKEKVVSQREQLESEKRVAKQEIQEVKSQLEPIKSEIEAMVQERDEISVDLDEWREAVKDEQNNLSELENKEKLMESLIENQLQVANQVAEKMSQSDFSENAPDIKKNRLTGNTTLPSEKLDLLLKSSQLGGALKQSLTYFKEYVSKAVMNTINDLKYQINQLERKLFTKDKEIESLSKDLRETQIKLNVYKDQSQYISQEEWDRATELRHEANDLTLPEMRDKGVSR
ncbi:MAG: hypothetical protein LBV19_08950 [Streptococcaceae bacterium]|jgi:hypothetical protein|nr:hypothetical protein [Streptococcaceae bacterium]